MSAPTIYDVARLAGVSHQTVTRFLHGYEGIRPQTRTRVEAALAELDYRPNAAARMLRARRTNRIGVLADRMDQGGPTRVLSGASDLARERGYVLDMVVADGASVASVASSLAMLVEHQVAGILATAQTQIVLNEVSRQAISTPMVIAPQASIGADGLTANQTAGRCAADHLVDLGHRVIGYVGGPELWLASRERSSGFTRRIAERGATLAWTREGDWSAASGRTAWESLTEDDRRVTGIGVANDSMAIGLISAAHASGVLVPRDLSVVGTDDVPEAPFLLPPLSTVVMDFEGEGRHVLGTLLAKIEGDPALGAIVPETPRVVGRASTRSLVGGE